MNPILVIFLIFVAIGGAYYLMIGLAESQAASSGSANSLVATYGPIAAKVLIAVLLAYAIFYIYDVIRTSNLERKQRNGGFRK